MRHIKKNEAAPKFFNFVKKKTPKLWGELHQQDKDIYREACEALLQEQHNMCGYTEVYFRDNIKGNIDHYVKRGIDNRKTFEWNNLIYATIDSTFGASYKDKVIKKEDYKHVFNPITDYPENYFEYSTLGEVYPKSCIDNSHRAKAEKTIEIFNLNDNKLCNQRKSIAIAIYKLKKGNLTNENIIDYLGDVGFDSLKMQLL